MFETIDEASVPVHPDLYKKNHKLWSHIFRTVPTPWLHCQISYLVNDLRVSDVYFLNDMEKLSDLSSANNIEIKNLHVVFLEATSGQWVMEAVRKIWLASEDGYLIHALELNNDKIYVFEHADLLSKAGSSKFKKNDLLHAFY